MMTDIGVLRRDDDDAYYWWLLALLAVVTSNDVAVDAWLALADDDRH
jgi:hypothetical protein